MIYSIYFSPTGGTKKCIDILIQNEEQVIEIDLLTSNMNDITFTSNDLVYIAVPSFAGRVPSVVIDKIKQVNGYGACVVPVVVYGNRAYDDTLLELKNTVEEVHFKSIAAVCANAQHSIMKQYGKNRPDEKDIEDLNGFAAKIKEAYLNKTYKDFEVPGNIPYIEMKKGTLFPFTSDACTMCGLCANECPTHAIPIDAPNTTNNDVCINCIHCISICPFSARSLNQEEVDKKAKRMEKLFEGRKKNELFM